MPRVKSTPKKPPVPDLLSQRQAAQDYAAHTSESVSVELDVEVAQRQLPRLPVSPPFLLCTHPTRWTVEDGLVFPQATRLPLQPGANGVTLSRDGGLMWRAAATQRMRRGWTVIAHRYGPNGESYLRRVAVRGGYAHHDCFETAYPDRQTVECDTVGRAKWLLGLIEQGVIPGPSVVALRDLHDAESEAFREKTERGASQQAEVHRRNAEAVKAKLDELKANQAPSTSEAVPELPDLD